MAINEANVTKRQIKNLYYDRRQFHGSWYWERGFLSCVLAGADIPGAVTPEHFCMPFNRVIFEALRAIKHKSCAGLYAKYGLLVSFLKATGNIEKAGGEAYIAEIRDMVGVPSAVYAFAARLIELKAGIKI